MTVILELSADEARALQEVSRAAGVSVEAVLHGLIAQVSPHVVTPPADPEVLADEFLADPEVLAEQRREQEEVEANIRRWHEERASA